MNWHWLPAAIAAAAAALFLTLLLRHLRRGRLVSDTPTARIRSAAQGYVKVSGRALPAGPEAQRAPLSGRACVWWDYRIDCEQRDTRDRHLRWEMSESASSVELFALQDGDARCLVGPVQAEVTPTVSNTWYGSSARPLSPPPPPGGAPVLRLGDWRYTERLIEVGAHLSVMGELRSRSETGDVAAAAQALLREWKQDQGALLARFDTNHDGRIDAGEWDAARRAAAAAAQGRTLTQDISRVSVISLPVSGEPFLIAPLSSRQLGNRERLYALLYLLLGLASVWACVRALRATS
ncbi:MAG: hypothetical protein JSR67_12680 [Proteobacteria bacterium]|nr:hypothetical protein [Pseudomonadota bacterium]